LTRNRSIGYLQSIGGGLDAVYNTISLDRLLYGGLAASYLDPMLDQILAYAREREAFNEIARAASFSRLTSNGTPDNRLLVEPDHRWSPVAV
jgi:hypothetical protein